jgi:citrate lyase alpha subunit
MTCVAHLHVKKGDEIRNTVLKSFKVKKINELVVTSNKLTNNSLKLV